MSVNMDFLKGFIIGFVIVAAVIFVIVCAVLNRNREVCQYDERQIMVRGKAFKIGFFTLIIYNYLYGMSIVVLGKAYIDQTTAFVLGVIVAIGTFAVYSIWNDAYVALNRNRKQLMILFALLGGFNLVAGVCGILDGTIFEDGVLSFRSINLFVGVLVVIIFITFALKHFFWRADE